MDKIKLFGKKILAVDDSPNNLTLISLFLKETEAEVYFAENGIIAISEVNNHEFDLILMDLQMPGMDGHETTKEIRRQGFKKPIIALTAHTEKSEHDKCRKSGFDSVLTKPVTQAELVKELHFYLFE